MTFTTRHTIAELCEEAAEQLVAALHQSHPAGQAEEGVLVEQLEGVDDGRTVGELLEEDEEVRYMYALYFLFCGAL